MSAPAAKTPSGHRADDMRAVSALSNMIFASILSTSKHDPAVALRRARALAELIKSTAEMVFCDGDPFEDARGAADRELAAICADKAKHGGDDAGA